MARTSRGEIFRMSRPRNAIEPETIFPGGSGIRRISERFATDLPDPDSPTMPSVSPCLTSKLTPSTALTTPSSVSKYVRKSLTASSLPLALVLIGLWSLVFDLRPSAMINQRPKTEDQRPILFASADRAHRAIHRPQSLKKRA